MKHAKRGVVIFSILALTCSVGGAQAQTEPNPWTPRVSVEARYVVPDLEDGFLNKFDSGESPRATPIAVSPDRERFFFQTFRGRLNEDCAESELLVHDVGPIRAAIEQGQTQALHPIASARLCTGAMSALRPAISSARWSDDGRIQFLGIDGGGPGAEAAPRSAYELDIGLNRVRRLTPAGYDVSSFHADAGATIFVAQLRTPEAFNTYPVRVLQRDFLTAFLYPWRFDNALYLRRGNGPVQELARLSAVLPSGNLGGGDPSPSVSPNGRWAIVLGALANRPPSDAWAGFHRGAGLRPGRLSALQFLLVDVRRGRVAAAFDAPWGYITGDNSGWGPIAQRGETLEPRAFWSFDSRSAVLVNTALPLADDPTRATRAFIAAFTPATGAYVALTPLRVDEQDEPSWRVRQVGWLESGRVLAVSRETIDGARLSALIYRYAEGVWTLQPNPSGADLPAQSFDPWLRQLTPPPLAEDVRVALVQDADSPQMMRAEYGGHAIDLLAQDPTLASVARADFQTVTWRDRAGRAHEGSLLLPLVRQDGHAPALVVQLQHHAPHIFQPDGAVTGAVSAQSLAARGMAVLYLPTAMHEEAVVAGRALDFTWTPTNTEATEAAPLRDAVDDAVEALGAQGLIDPTRVGLIGFSRMGFLTYYTITHPGRTRIGASVIIDGRQYGWYEYTRFPNDVLRGVNQADAMYGAERNFWTNPAPFLSGMPIFNVHRVQGATLFQYINDQQLIAAIENLSAFQMNEKPAEWLHYGPDGFHLFQAPRQRYASISATVDWMAFWLLGEERDAPEAREQYQRWRQMRRDAEPPTAGAG